MSQDLFRSAHLIYRAVECPDDEKFFYSLNSDFIGQQLSGAATKPVSKKAVRDYMRLVSEEMVLGVVICLPVVGKGGGGEKEKEELVPIGEIHLGPSKGPNGESSRHGSIGIDVVVGYRGNGYGTEAIRWIVHWALMFGGLHSVRIARFSFNQGARRLYDRMGFVCEGKKRHFVWMNGGWHDLIEFSLLEDEWRELRDKGKW